MNHRVHAVVGVLSDDADPMVTVMKLEKAPQETYADIGGLDQQIQVQPKFRLKWQNGGVGVPQVVDLLLQLLGPAVA